MWLHIKFVKQVRERKIHLASNLQDADGKSSSLESSACIKLTEPSLAVSLLPKNVMSNVGGSRTGKRKKWVKEEVMNTNKRKIEKKIIKLWVPFKQTAVDVIRAAGWSPYPGNVGCLTFISSLTSRVSSFPRMTEGLMLCC